MFKNCEQLPPFKGLEYFDEADADLFFGRELLTARLVGRLREGRFLAIVGASGSGKSSVVRAGLIPALKGGTSYAASGAGKQLADGSFPPADSTPSRIQLITPTAHPLEALALNLTQTPESTLPYARVLDDLERGPHGLHLAVQRLVPDGRGLLLIVDQFEELYTLCRDEFEREAFVDNLLTAATAEVAGTTRVVLAVRADFYARCAQYDDLRQAIAEHQEYIGPMSVEELRRAIEEPARRGGWEFEAGLVDLILRDIGDEPGGLPLLSHALLETWNQRSGHTLTLKGYTESGGVRGAISHTAESIYLKLLPEQQEIAHRVFLRLTELGEGTEDTRRRAARRELIVREHDTATVQEVLNILAEARLITLGADRVEVAHEALIREWPRLREWLNQDRAGLRLHRQLTEAAEDWERLQRDEGALYRGVRLAQAAEWADSQIHSDQLNPVERAFLDAGLAERDRLQAQEQARVAREARLERHSRTILRVLVAVLLVATLGALVLVAVALNQRQVALSNAVQAQRLALTSAAQLAADRGNPDLALALALAANRVDQPIVQAQLTLADQSYTPGFRRRFTGHTDRVNGVAFSPDGKTALSSSGDKTLVLWDVASGQAIRRFEGHTGAVNAVAFSPDGKTALSGSADGTLILWDVASGQVVHRLQGHADAVNAVAFSPDGKTALSGSTDRTLILWDVASGQAIRRFEGHTGAVNAVALSPDGKTALSGSTDQTVILWDVATAQIIRRLNGNRESVNAVAFSPDGKTALSGDGSSASFGETIDHVLIVWNVASGQVVHRFEGHTAAVNAVAFSPDGKTALTGAVDTNVILWGIENGAEIRRYEGHSSRVNAVAFSPDGKTALSGSADTTLIVWDVATGGIIRRLAGQTSIVNAVAFSPDDKTALSGAEDGTLTLWDLGTGDVLRRFTGHSSSVAAVVFSSDGKNALSGSLDRTLILWDVATGRAIRTFVGHANVVNTVAFSPDGKTALSGSYDGTAILWDVATGRAIRQLAAQAGSVNAVAFGPDGKTGLLGMADGTLILYDLDHGAELRRFPGHLAAVTSVAFNPDGKIALSGSEDQTLLVWDVASGQAIRRFTGHTDAVNTVAFSPDGKTALSGSSDKTMRLWRIDSLEELIAWTRANHTLTALPCDQRALYGLEPLCDPSSVSPAPH